MNSEPDVVCCNKSHLFKVYNIILSFVKQVESEIISKLDVLVEGGKGDTQYKELFYKM